MRRHCRQLIANGLSPNGQSPKRRRLPLVNKPRQTVSNLQLGKPQENSRKSAISVTPPLEGTDNLKKSQILRLSHHDIPRDALIFLVHSGELIIFSRRFWESLRRHYCIKETLNNRHFGAPASREPLRRKGSFGSRSGFSELLSQWLGFFQNLH